MTISPTAGSMTQDNSGWEITDSDTYIPIGGVVHQQPDGFRSDSQYGYLQNWRIYFQDAGGTAYSRTAELDIDNKQVTDTIEQTTDSPVNAWQLESESGQKSNGKFAMTVPIDKQYDFSTWKAHIKVFYEGTKAASTNPPLALAFQSIEDPDAGSSDIFEETGLHSASPATYEWTPYMENESCSAYLTRRIAGKNTTIMNGKSDRGIPTPLYGYWQATPE